MCGCGRQSDCAPFFREPSFASNVDILQKNNEQCSGSNRATIDSRPKCRTGGSNSNSSRGSIGWRKTFGFLPDFRAAHAGRVSCPGAIWRRRPDCCKSPSDTSGTSAAMERVQHRAKLATRASCMVIEHDDRSGSLFHAANRLYRHAVFGFLATVLLLDTVQVAQGQYKADTPLYEKKIAEAEAELTASLQGGEYVEDTFFPENKVRIRYAHYVQMN